MDRRFTSPVANTSRDVLLLPIAPSRLLVASCDAAGGIGSKPRDRVRAAARLVGKMTARVALMELLATGADPLAIVGTFAVEPKPTANLMIEGVKDELRNARLTGLRMLCSSEKNVRVEQTGLGITALGIVSDSGLRIGRSRDGDEIVAVGEPFVGREVIRAEKNQKTASTLDVVKLRKNPSVRELIPVGSRGILCEARVIAEDSKLVFEPYGSSQLDLVKSAGPATVLLCSVSGGNSIKLKKALGRKPNRTIGKLRAK